MKKLEDLNLSWSTSLTDISFLEKNKDIKILNLAYCDFPINCTILSKLVELEELNVGNTKISDISFLKNLKNIKKLKLTKCENIENFGSQFNRNFRYFIFRRK